MLKAITTSLNKKKAQRATDIGTCNYFFFYGSLMQRFTNFNRYLKKRVCSIEVGYCQGYLYNLPLGFPGLIIPDEPCPTLVAGEIMRFHNPGRVMKVLDRLESYRPHNEGKSIYLRRKMTLICATKTALGQPRKIEAWVYTYPERHLSYEHQREVRIECGQWQAFDGGHTTSAEVFQRLNYCDKQQQIIIDPMLQQEPVFQQPRPSYSCHDLCKNSHLCSGKKPVNDSSS